MNLLHYEQWKTENWKYFYKVSNPHTAYIEKTYIYKKISTKTKRDTNRAERVTLRLSGLLFAEN